MREPSFTDFAEETFMMNATVRADHLEQLRSDLKGLREVLSPSTLEYLAETAYSGGRAIGPREKIARQAASSLAWHILDYLRDLTEKEDGGLRVASERLPEGADRQHLYEMECVATDAKYACLVLLLLTDALAEDRLPAGVDADLAENAVVHFGFAVQKDIEKLEAMLPPVTDSARNAREVAGAVT